MQNNIVKPNQSLVDLLEDLSFYQSLEDWQKLLRELFSSYLGQKNSVQHTTIEISDKLHQVQHLCRFIRQLKAQVQNNSEQFPKLAKAVNKINYDYFEEIIFSALGCWIDGPENKIFIIKYVSRASLSFRYAEKLITKCFSLTTVISG